VRAFGGRGWWIWLCTLIQVLCTTLINGTLEKEISPCQCIYLQVRLFIYQAQPDNDRQSNADRTFPALHLGYTGNHYIAYVPAAAADAGDAQGLRLRPTGGNNQRAQRAASAASSLGGSAKQPQEDEPSAFTVPTQNSGKLYRDVPLRVLCPDAEPMERRVHVITQTGHSDRLWTYDPYNPKGDRIYRTFPLIEGVGMAGSRHFPKRTGQEDSLSAHCVHPVVDVRLAWCSHRVEVKESSRNHAIGSVKLLSHVTEAPKQKHGRKKNQSVSPNFEDAKLPAHTLDKACLVKAHQPLFVAMRRAMEESTAAMERAREEAQEADDREREVHKRRRDVGSASEGEADGQGPRSDNV
jgi:hypothetical protein